MRILDVILWRIADAPVTGLQLIRWIRMQWPRVLPDAVGRAVCLLHRMGFIEVERGRWQVSNGRGNGRR